MPCCSLKYCSARRTKDQPQLSLHRLPKGDVLRGKWLEAIGAENINTRHKEFYLCSLHFEESQLNRNLNIVRLYENSVPTQFLKPSSNIHKQVATVTNSLRQPVAPDYETRTKEDAPRPSTGTPRTLKHDHNYTAFPDSDTPVLLPEKEPPQTEEDPLLIKIQPCRFCREYNKECLDISDKPYVIDMKTTLVFNNMEIQIDFNDGLSDKVCRSCDSQLRGMMSFIGLVKKAQDNFKEINEDTDTIRVKTEIVGDDEDMENIEIKTDNESNDEPIEDCVTVEETPCVKKPVKRKFAQAVKKRKAKIDKSEHQFTWDMEEDVVDIDNVNKSEHSARGTGVRSSELRISGLTSETLVLQSVSDETLRTVRGETNRSGYLSKTFK